MPIIEHGLDAQGRPRWVRERFYPAFYTAPADWIDKLRIDGRRPSVHELLDNDRGGPLDGMIVVREVSRDGKWFVVLSDNASIQFAVEIERDAKRIADAEIRALPPQEAWEIARELDARSSPPVELMPEPARVIYDADVERRVVIFRRDKDGSFGYEEQRFSVQPWERDEMRRVPDWKQRYPIRWERAWKLSGGDLETLYETAAQALAEARANVTWLADRLKNDSLKLVDMIWLDDEMTSCRPLRRAWGEEEIFLDHWGHYEKVFPARPSGSVSSRDLLQPEGDGTFLLLRSGHVEQIIESLRSHLDELRVTTAEQLDTLEQWKSLSLANHRHMVAYIFNRGGGPDTTAPGEDAGGGEAEAERGPEGGTSKAKRLEVKTRGLQFGALILLGLLMVPIGSALVIGELAKGARRAPALLIGVAVLAIYGAVVWLFRRAYVKSVKFFSDDGLVRNDGRGFTWADLSRVINRVRLNRVTGIQFVWRTEIQFRDGETAWLLPTKINNFAEVYELVRGLPCEHTEVRA
jgi:hypothetical protein